MELSTNQYQTFRKSRDFLPIRVLGRDGCLLRIELGEEFLRFAVRSDDRHKLFILK